jgi:ssDNA-binding Zn-finger/Zn-ribbon topoisomerase 1
LSPSREEFLKDHLCPNCHVGILESHPEEKLMVADFYKCPICGFTRQIKKFVKWKIGREDGCK